MELTPNQRLAYELIVPGDRLFRYQKATIALRSQVETVPPTFTSWVHVIEAIKRNDPPQELIVLTDDDWLKILNMAY